MAYIIAFISSPGQRCHRDGSWAALRWQTVPIAVSVVRVAAGCGHHLVEEQQAHAEGPNQGTEHVRYGNGIAYNILRRQRQVGKVSFRPTIPDARLPGTVESQVLPRVEEPCQ